MRITNKIIDNYAVYNMNTNKALLDDLNTQMSTRKKVNDPTKDPVTAINALRFRGSLSEYTQYLDKNVTDAASWTDSTQAAIDTAKELMRSLKAEYTSAANGTNESTDRWTYYNNMVNVVNEYMSVGDTTNENRYLFSGARTGDSLTFSDKDFHDRAKETGGVYPDVHEYTYNYKGITEQFTVEDLESYSFTANTDRTATGITDDDIANLNVRDDTNVTNVEAFRIRLSYDNLDETQNDTVKIKYNYEKDGKIEMGTLTSLGTLTIIVKDKDGNDHSITNVRTVSDDYKIDPAKLDYGEVYLNYKTGNLIFGKKIQEELSGYLNNGGSVEYRYNKSVFKEGDAKPEHYFPCIDVGLGDEYLDEYGNPKAKVYNIEFSDAAGTKKEYTGKEQDIYYNVGENQQLKVNVRAEDVFTLDARRDLDELKNALEAMDTADAKVDRLKEMQADTLRYGDADQVIIADLLSAAEKEAEYAKSKVDMMFSNGMTKSGTYFDVVNLAGTSMGTAVNRLNLIRNRLTEHQSTTNAQASDNENIDISTLAVEVNSATLSFSAALQVTGKISQQSLVNFL